MWKPDGLIWGGVRALRLFKDGMSDHDDELRELGYVSLVPVGI